MLKLNSSGLGRFHAVKMMELGFCDFEALAVKCAEEEKLGSIVLGYFCPLILGTTREAAIK